MALSASHDPRAAAAVIFLTSNYLKVARVDAATHAADVINLQTIRDRALGQLDDDTVNGTHFAIDVGICVTPTVISPEPEPAPGLRNWLGVVFYLLKGHGIKMIVKFVPALPTAGVPHIGPRIALPSG